MKSGAQLSSSPPTKLHYKWRGAGGLPFPCSLTRPNKWLSETSLRKIGRQDPSRMFGNWFFLLGDVAWYNSALVSLIISHLYYWRSGQELQQLATFCQGGLSGPLALQTTQLLNIAEEVFFWVFIFGGTIYIYIYSPVFISCVSGNLGGHQSVADFEVWIQNVRCAP